MQQGIKSEKIFRVKSNFTNEEKRLVRVLTKNENQAKKAITNGVVMCRQKFKCEPSKQQPKVMQCFKCQAHCQIAANCDNMQRCPKCMNITTSKNCNQNEPCCANSNERHSAAYKGCQMYKEAKLKALAVSYAEALINKQESKDIERAQRIASDVRTHFENNLESMLSSHFTKLENKSEQITKFANERLIIDLQSQIDQLNINLQNTKKNN